MLVIQLTLVRAFVFILISDEQLNKVLFYISILTWSLHKFARFAKYKKGVNSVHAFILYFTNDLKTKPYILYVNHQTCVSLRVLKCLHVGKSVHVWFFYSTVSVYKSFILSTFNMHWFNILNIKLILKENIKRYF